MVRTYTLADIDSVAQELLEKSRSKTILFYGEMGAGKTTLIKSLIKALKVNDEGSSPTFSLVNEYESPEGPIYHFDFYRIEDENEAYDIGIEEYFSSGAWIFIEWPDNIRNLLPEESQIVKISSKEKDTKELKFC